MIDKELISNIVEKSIEGSEHFLVEVKVTPDNTIIVEIDSMVGVDIDTCARLTREIEQQVDREIEDYELEVGSAGLTSPLKVRRQYEKNIGNELEVLTRDGRKLTGVLKSINEAGDEFTLLIAEKVKEPGKKRPVIVDTEHIISVSNTKTVKYLIKFK